MDNKYMKWLLAVITFVMWLMSILQTSDFFITYICPSRLFEMILAVPCWAFLWAMSKADKNVDNWKVSFLLIAMLILAIIYAYSFGGSIVGIIAFVIFFWAYWQIKQGNLKNKDGKKDWKY